MASAISEKTVLTKKKKAAPVQTKQISIGKKNASTISKTAVVAKTKPTSLKTDDVYVRNTSAIFETNVVTKRITPAKRKSKLCCLKLCALLSPFVQYCSNHTI